jgi:transposase-like protein
MLVAQNRQRPRALPKSAHKDATAERAEIYNAEDRDHAEQASKAFAADYGAKWPKAVAKMTNDLDVLLDFFDFPGEHWIHVRTTNPRSSGPSQPSGYGSGSPSRTTRRINKL